MRSTILLPLLLLLIAGCSTSPTAQNAGSVIVPLAVGNEWIGRTTRYNFSGGINTSLPEPWMVITSMQTINGEEWFFNENGASYINRPDGCWTHLMATDSFRLARYPGQVGDTSSLLAFIETFENGMLGDTFDILSSIAATDTSVTVPAGTYSCYHYQSKAYAYRPGVAMRIFSDEFYAPNVGPVRSVTYTLRPDSTVGIQSVWELTSVTLR